MNDGRPNGSHDTDSSLVKVDRLFIRWSEIDFLRDILSMQARITQQKLHLLSGTMVTEAHR